jgi:hypothetical protein
LVTNGNLAVSDKTEDIDDDAAMAGLADAAGEGLATRPQHDMIRLVFS